MKRIPTLDIDVESKTVSIEVPINDKRGGVYYWDIDTKKGRDYLTKVCKKNSHAVVLTEEPLLWKVKVDKHLTYAKLLKELKLQGWDPDLKVVVKCPRGL